MNTNHYHNAIRDLVTLMINKGKTGQIIKHAIGPDEIHDPTLVSLRVYGNRHDYDVVMVCAGTNSIWQALPEREIYLPTKAQLFRLKKKYRQFGGDLI
ncbi:hypothetical protein [Faucicola boevrei]|uniref:hypothetical protein n=1 Tax=Faucicola boevrei TaxID=346665 RepID=UPI00037B738C|nr:hypothetical protein [Moraxella boevrei]